MIFITGQPYVGMFVVVIIQQCYFLLVPVARRCVPTGLDLSSELGQIFNLTAAEEIQNATTDLGELFTTLSIQSIVDGSL